MPDSYISPSLAEPGQGAPSRGEVPRPWRTPFQVDQDRIIKSKAFRRLAHKTQVFVATSSDHFRSRLTHTLEVSQVARTLARGFSLNEDLAEAISLGHDLGHTPFGHAGEKALNRYVPGGFNHQAHSVRVVTRLANNGQGLNLTEEVVDGIGKHSKGGGPIFVRGRGSPMTQEGDLVRASDIIAYLAHDLDDALESDLLKAGDIPTELKAIFGPGAFDRVGVMVDDLLTNTRAGDGRLAFSFSPRIGEAMLLLREFLDKTVYHHPHLIDQLNYGTACVRYIFLALTGSQELYETLPLRHLAENRFQAVCDFIAGMTDRYAITYAQNLANGVPTAKFKGIDVDSIPMVVEF